MTPKARLLSLGYAELGTADGWFGPKTADAVGRFRHRNGPSEGRTVDSEVWAILFDPELNLVTGEVPREPPLTILACDGFILGGLGSGGTWLDPLSVAKALDGQALDLRFRLPKEAWSTGRAEVVWAPQDGPYSAGPALAAAALGAWLLEQGIRLPLPGAASTGPEPSQAYHALDTEGRGREDYVARLESLSYEGKARDYSLVLLLRQEGGGQGAWKVFLLGGDLGQAPAAPATPVAMGAADPAQILPLRSWSLRAALDVDGDGGLEFILATQELDGAGVYLRKLKGGEILTLAENGGGS